MQIRRVNKGESVTMPLVSIGKGSGISVLKSLINGILVSLNPKESSSGVIFVSEVQLNEVGFFKSIEQSTKTELSIEAKDEKEQ